MTQQSLLQYWSQLGRCSSYSGHRQDNHDHGANHGDGGDKDAAIIMLMMKVERTVGEDEKGDGEGCNDYQGDKRMMMMRRRKKIIMMLTMIMMIMMVMRRKKKRMRSEKTALTAR